MAPDARLRAGEHIAYSVGGAAVNLISALITSYLLVYFSMVVGVDTVLATSVLAVSKMMDSVADLLAGYIVDHTKGKKGKAKPWYIRSVLPMVLGTIALFSMPHAMGAVAQILWIFIAYNFASTVCNTMISVSYSALNGLMTTNQASRGLNGGFIMLFNVISSLFLTSTILKFTEAFGGGDVYSQTGWTIAICIYGAVAIICALICHFFTHERVDREESAEHNDGKIDRNVYSITGEKIGMGKMLKALICNKYWVLAVLVGVTIMTFLGFSGTAVIYFSQFILGDVDVQATLNAANSLCMVPAVILSTVLIPKFGKRNMLLMGMIINLAGGLIPLFSLDTTVVCIASAVKGIGYGLAAAPMGSLIQDTITYGKWKNGFSNVGIGNAANTFIMQAGNSMGTVILGFLLAAAGFIEKSLTQAQSAMDMISFIYIGMPIICAALCILLLVFYKLDKIYPQIEADLKAGKYAPAVLPEAEKE